MIKSQKIIIGAIIGVIIILLGAVAFLSFNQKNDNLKIEKALEPIVTAAPLNAETIMVTASRFAPDKITLKKGTAINIANFSGKDINIISENKDLNIGILSNSDTSGLIDLPSGEYKISNSYNGISAVIEIAEK